VGSVNTCKDCGLVLFDEIESEAQYCLIHLIHHVNHDDVWENEGGSCD
jgi:hypothetical protein